MTFHVTVSLFGGSYSKTSPEMCSEPSGARTVKLAPSLRSISTAKPEKYFLLNLAEVSASHTFSGVETM